MTPTWTSTDLVSIDCAIAALDEAICSVESAEIALNESPTAALQAHKEEIWRIGSYLRGELASLRLLKLAEGQP